MADIIEILTSLEAAVPLIRTVVIVVILGFSFGLIAKITHKRLLSKARTKHQISNIEMFYDIIRYAFFFILILFIVFSYTGDFTALGLTIGLFSAALGFALQKPITGVAAWLMIALRRPFEIGDRVIIGNIRGDVIDITLTHVYISEIGGIVPGEETSGRIIMVPNSQLFEQNIVNYTNRDECILDKVSVVVTFDSNIDRVVDIALESVKKFTKEVIRYTKKEPYVRTFFDPSGMEVQVRYLAPARSLQEYSSNISREMHGRIMKAKDVDIAYPHTEVVLNRKG